MERKRVYPVATPWSNPQRSMRPLLHWLRSAVLMFAVMMTVGVSAWASPLVKQGAKAEVPAWSWHQLAPDTDAANDSGQIGLNTALRLVVIDDDRAELDVMHSLTVPDLLPDTHPPLAPAPGPADNWPGLPLRPPRP